MTGAGTAAAHIMGMTNSVGPSRAFTTGPATTLRHLPALAARYIQRVGWTQNTEQATDGRVSLTGALRLCAPTVSDGLIARGVFCHKGHAEWWNDADGRTQVEVLAYLVASEITDEDLAQAFGPQWSEIIAMIRRAANCTADELTRLTPAVEYPLPAVWSDVESARDPAGDSALAALDSAANAATRSTAYFAARVGAHLVSMGAVRAAGDSAAGTATGDAHRYVADGAAGALVIRDLIGQHDFTQEHYDELTSLWRTTIGPLHPEDADPGTAVLTSSQVVTPRAT